jgi:AcrR family transcriptional regulator
VRTESGPTGPTTPPGTRDRIVRAAARLFAARGYHGTGMTELLGAVGVGKGGFYHHISSKEQLLMEIMLQPIDRVLSTSAAILAAHPTDPCRALRALGADLGEAMASDLDSWTVFLREYSALSPDGKSVVLERRKQYLDRWRGVLQQGAQGGVFRDLNLAFVDSILGLFIYTHLWNHQQEAEDLTESVMSVLLHGVAPCEASPNAAAAQVARSSTTS